MSVTTTAYHYPFIENLERFAEDAAFLWLLRGIALNQPHYTPQDLAALEARIDDNIKGLLIQPEPAWRVVKAQMALEEPGEVFIAAIVAFKSLESSRIQTVLELALTEPALTKAFVSALLWLPEGIRAPWLDRFLKSKDLTHKAMAIDLLRLQSRDPGDYLIALLRRTDVIEHEVLHAACLRLIGECKLRSLVPALNVAMNSDLPKVAFWSRWSAVLLGNAALTNELVPYLAEPSEFQVHAMALYFRTAAASQAKRQISQMAKSPEHMRLALKATAILGDAQAVPWLITCMENPKWARLSAEAFTHITGIQLEENKLDFDLPDIAPNAMEEEDIELDEDENLPWPHVDKIKAVWQKYGRQYPPGQRLFLGRRVEAGTLLDVVDNGLQRHRIAASMELALLQHLTPLKNVCAKQGHSKRIC